MDDVAVLALLALTLVGLMVGSFLNVVITRVPQGDSIMRPRSRCPGCGAPIQPRDNVPVASWLMLKGRCRGCAQPIPVTYPLVEGVTALSWLAVGLWATADPQRWWIAPLLLAWVSVGIALVVIDIRYHRLPNAVVYPMYPITAACLVLASFGSSSPAWWSVLAGVFVWVTPLALIYVLTRGRGMGLGDVKIAVPLGATLGWFGISVALIGLVVAFVLGAVVGAGVLVRRSQVSLRGHRRIAFGPFLLVGSAASVVWGASLWQGYMSFVGLG